jgi:signal transduction histidine kinase
VPASLVDRLLAFARDLQRASTFEELLLVTRCELEISLGYVHAWLLVADHEDAPELRLIDVAGAQRGRAWEVAPRLTIAGDPMMEEIVRSAAPVVVADARTDPRTNKEIVAKLGNRTIINVPLRLLDKPFGAFGTGTFGEEGCRPPTREALDYLVGMASQLAVAAGRIRFVEERARAQEKLERVQEHLRQAQKMEAVGRLAGGIAHDFNNLLTVVLAHGSVLLEKMPPEDSLRVSVAAIVDAAQRASRLTSQLLTFSRHQPAELRAVDVAALLRDLVPMIRTLVGDRVEIAFIAPDDVGWVAADPSQLERIVVNLAVNARDAMPNGGKLTLELSDVVLDAAHIDAHVGLREGRHVLLTVSDTGEGMDPETQSRIFDPFFTTKAPGKGTGLGLTTVHGLVQRLSGTTWVQSEPGKGAVFKIHLPCTDSRGEPAPAEHAARDSAPSPVSQQRPASDTEGDEDATRARTILVVDDEEPLRALVHRILSDGGYSVLVARSPVDAIRQACLREDDIDLLVTDVVMPEMSGCELSRRLRELRPSLRVLYMSGYTETMLGTDDAWDSAALLLNKPFTANDLLRMVHQALV